ncbi:hypothetical protein HanIR_Chr17g0865181 [Helianthus annuus]|nr:hypothetical protein HanIR_Chr17g0865181 [Helianthus annuus]
MVRAGFIDPPDTVLKLYPAKMEVMHTDDPTAIPASSPTYN